MFLLLLSLTVNSSKLHLQLDMFNNSAYSDRIYMTTDNGGLVSFDPEDSSWNSVNSLSGLPSNETKDVFLRGDSVFVLSRGGITIFDENLSRLNFQNFNPLFFVADTNPICLYIKDSTVILGGQNGVQWFNLNNFGNLSREVGHVDYNFQVFEILPYDTSFLLGSSRGTYRVNSNFGDTLMMDSSGETYSIFVSDGSIWTGGSWGCKEITADTAIFSDATVWKITEIDEQIYIGTEIGYYRYNGSWNYIRWGNIRGIFKVLPQNLIASVVRYGGIRFDGSSNILYPPGIATNSVTDLVQTPDGKIYLSHKYGRRLSVFDGVSWKILNHGNQWGLSGGYSFNLESDSEGRIYLGLWNWEDDTVLYCLDTRTDTMFQPVQLPVSGTVTGMLVDSNDDLWIGVLVSGGSRVMKMHRVNGDSLEWTIYNNPEISWKRVFAEGSEGIYCGNSPSIGGSGIHILRDDGSIGSVTGDLGSSTTSMVSDINGNIWAGLEDKLVYIEGDNVEREYTSNKVDGLAVDFQGGVWCYSSLEGLSYLNPEDSWEQLPQELTEIQSFGLEDVIYPLHFTTDNTLFVCTYNGLYEFDINFNYPDSGKIVVYPNPFNYSRHHRLNFSLHDIGEKRLSIYDIIGNRKGEYTIPSGREIFWIDKEQLNLSSGLYRYFITDGGVVIHKGKFVVVR